MRQNQCVATIHVGKVQHISHGAPRVHHEYHTLPSDHYQVPKFCWIVEITEAKTLKIPLHSLIPFQHINHCIHLTLI
jgi:hypothetical protein